MTTTSSQPRLSGMPAFLVMWSGQFISLMGSAMTGFALPIYVFGETERVRELALLGLAYMLPLIIMSPIAGTLVDRSNRKLMMIISDLMSGISTIFILVMFILFEQTGQQLPIWPLYIANIINGTFQTFQWPAFSAAISLMLPKEQYGRAHGLTSLAENGSGIFAPLLAGTLLGFLGSQAGLRLILIIDIVTFVAAIAGILIIHVPPPPKTVEGQAAKGSFLGEAIYGFRYILQRPSLLGLQMIFFFGNFLATLAFTTFAAYILYRTDQNSQIYGYVASAGAAGGIAGGLLMSIWGGPKPRVHGVLVGWLLSGLVGMSLLGLGRVWPIWAVCSFLGSAIIPVLNGSNQAIWQAKVAPDIQGRVFSIRRLIAWVTNPLAQLAVIPLADKWLEPAMRAGGSLVDSFDWLVGTGPGAGTALIFVFAGIGASLVGLAGYFIPVIRHAETILPDYDTMQQVEESTEMPAAAVG